MASSWLISATGPVRRLLVVVSVVAAACSQDELSLNEAKSELKATLSIASEAKLLASYTAQGRATKNYRCAHAEYLGRQFREIETNLNKPAHDAAVRRIVDALRKPRDEIRAELERLSHDETKDELEEAGTRLDRVAGDVRMVAP